MADASLDSDRPIHCCPRRECRRNVGGRARRFPLAFPTEGTRANSLNLSFSSRWRCGTKRLRKNKQS
jgi:hypothetical protein